MAKLIGRKEEIIDLDNYTKSGKAEFIAVYGRRRIGKTYLVRQYFSNHFAFETSGVIDGTPQEQMAVFYSSLCNAGYQGAMPKNWIEAFQELRKLLEPKIGNSGKRVVIFIDELPCFETPKSGFLRAFSNFWNTWANWQDNVMLIVCGSATSWMTDKLINNHAGLYNRLTHQIHLREFSLSETFEYFENQGFGYSKLMVLQIYMAFGGVPYYLSYFRKGESFAKAIDRLFFNNGALQNEFNQMFAALFRQPQPYMQVVKYLATKKSGVARKEINDALKKIDNGHITKILNNLEACDFIRKYYTIGSNGKLKSSSCYYQLTDFYTIFYFTFHEKASAANNYFQQNIDKPVINTWLGLAFERVVAAHIVKVKKAVGIDKILTEHYSWRSTDTDDNVQIDMVINRADKITNICEIKYSAAEYHLTKAEYLNIQHRVEVFKRETRTHNTVWPILITVFGVEQGNYANAINLQLTVDDLF
jgi:hypothetical protein